MKRRSKWLYVGAGVCWGAVLYVLYARQFMTSAWRTLPVLVLVAMMGVALWRLAEASLGDK